MAAPQNTPALQKGGSWKLGNWNSDYWTIGKWVNGLLGNIGLLYIGLYSPCSILWLYQSQSNTVKANIIRPNREKEERWDFRPRKRSNYPQAQHPHYRPCISASGRFTVAGISDQVHVLDWCVVGCGSSRCPVYLQHISDTDIWCNPKDPRPVA